MMMQIVLKKYRSALKILTWLLLFTSNPCFAGLGKVMTITVTPSKLNKSGYLQVSEVKAIQTNTGSDLALFISGAVATSSSSYSSAANANNVISGIAPDRYPKIFHSRKNDGSSWVKVTLKESSELDSVTIYGRKDSHSNRDFYDIRLDDSSGNLIYQKTDLDASGASNSVSINLTIIGSLGVGANTEIGSTSPASATVNTDVSSDLYKKIDDNLQQKNVAVAVRYAEQYFRQYPEGENIDDVYMVLATGKLVKNDLNGVKKWLELLLDKFPDSNRVSEAQRVLLQISEAQGGIKTPHHSKSVNSGQHTNHSGLITEAARARGNKEFKRASELLDKIIAESANPQLVHLAEKQKKVVYSAKSKHVALEEKSRLSNLKYEKVKKERNIKKNEEFFAQWDKNREIQRERNESRKEISTREKAAAEERKQKTIKDNNMRFPLSHLDINKKSMFDFYGMRIGETSKTEAIKIYGLFLSDKISVKQEDMHIVFMTIDRYIKQVSHQIHDNVSFECFHYFAKYYPNHRSEDCLYFYKDTLVGGKFDRNQENCDNRCDIVFETVKNLTPFFPEKIYHDSKEGTYWFQRSNDALRLNATIWGSATKNTTITQKSWWGVNQIKGFKSENQIYGNVCVAPIAFQEMLSGYSETGRYTCFK